MNDTRKRWIKRTMLMTGILACVGSWSSSGGGGGGAGPDSTTPANAQGGNASDGAPQGGDSAFAADGSTGAPHAPVPWSSVQAPAHPQVLFDATRLAALRA